jgi:molecular chaperone DnaJ
VQARIPAGVKDGSRIRLKGKGAPGERGGPNGDLFVVVHVTAHPVFTRKGDNLTVTVPLTFAEAVLGANIKVPNTDGSTVTLKIPAGTANGRTFRVRGRGVTRKDGTKGDLLAAVDVVVPTALDDASRAALIAFADASDQGDPREQLLASVEKK